MAGDTVTFDFRYPEPLPDTKGWGPAEPPNYQGDKIKAHSVWVPGVHRDIWELCDRLAREIELRGMRLVTPGCWGFARKPRFHGWGLALDINAPKNVWGTDESRSEIATEYRWVVALMEEYGFFWLGPAIKDWMHFSFVGSPEDAARMTEKARRLRLGEDEDEMAWADSKDGAKARLAGEPLKDSWNSDKKFGWRQEDRIQRGLVEPVASDPENHDHSLPDHQHSGGQTGGVS